MSVTSGTAFNYINDVHAVRTQIGLCAVDARPSGPRRQGRRPSTATPLAHYAGIPCTVLRSMAHGERRRAQSTWQRVYRISSSAGTARSILRGIRIDGGC